MRVRHAFLTAVLLRTHRSILVRTASMCAPILTRLAVRSSKIAGRTQEERGD